MARPEFAKLVTGQRLYFHPTEGRPTSAPSVLIKNQASTIVTADSTDNVTLDPVSTTVASAAAVGDMSVPLASVSGLEVKQTYLLTNSLAQQERVRVRGVDSTSAKLVYLYEPLQFAHDTAATFVGTRFYRTLSSTEVSVLYELYRARASYQVAGLPYIIETPFDVVLTPLHNPLTSEWVKQRRPDVMAFQPPAVRGDDLLDLRESAWDEVLKGIREESTNLGSMRPALIRTPEDVEKWALAEFDFLAQRNGIPVLRGVDMMQALNFLDIERQKRKGTSLSTLDFYDKFEDDSRGIDEEKPINMNLIR